MIKTVQTPDMLAIYQEFHKCMDKQGFLPLIRCASKIFDAPVIFTDEHYHLISQYPLKNIGDIVYDTYLETGALPIETIAAYQDAYLGDPGNRYKPFFVKEGLVKDSPRIFAEVYDEVKILGHIGVLINEEEVKPWQLEAAAILADVLRIKLNLTKHLTPTLSRNLQDLLNRKSSPQVKSRSFSSLFQTCNKPGILLVAPLDQSKAQQAFASVALNYCLHKFPNTIPTIHNNDLVILVTDGKKQPFSALQKSAKDVAGFLSQHKITCGAVYPVEDLYLLPNYYLQGRLTALLENREERQNSAKAKELSFYADMMPEPLYLYLSEHPESACFIHPALKAIWKYDNENDTEFLPTLECYCQCLFQKNETSQKLHIHRNTLLYRLNRMEELFDLDLKCVRTLHHLLISFELGKYHKFLQVSPY